MRIMGGYFENQQPLLIYLPLVARVSEVALTTITLSLRSVRHLFTRWKDWVIDTQNGSWSLWIREHHGINANFSIINQLYVDVSTFTRQLITRSRQKYPFFVVKATKVNMRRQRHTMNTVLSAIRIKAKDSSKSRAPSSIPGIRWLWISIMCLIPLSYSTMPFSTVPLDMFFIPIALRYTRSNRSTHNSPHVMPRLISTWFNTTPESFALTDTNRVIPFEPA